MRAIRRQVRFWQLRLHRAFAVDSRPQPPRWDPASETPEGMGLIPSRVEVALEAPKRTRDDAIEFDGVADDNESAISLRIAHEGKEAEANFYLRLKKVR